MTYNKHWTTFYAKERVLPVKEISILQKHAYIVIHVDNESLEGYFTFGGKAKTRTNQNDLASYSWSKDEGTEKLGHTPEANQWQPGIKIPPCLTFYCIYFLM